MLNSLPTEILTSVFSHFASCSGQPSERDHDGSNAKGDILHHRQYRSNLINLCKTSRRLRSIAEPLLYRIYIKPDTIKAPLTLKDIHGYTQTLLQRPDLARHVRIMSIETWFQFFTWEQRGTLYPDEPFLDDGTLEAFLGDEPSHDSLPSPRLLLLYQKHLQTLDLTDAKQDSWYRSLEEGYEDAEISLLLTLVPNVKHLHIVMPNWNHYWHHYSRSRVLPHFTDILSKNSFLQHLTSIDVEKTRQVYDYNIEGYSGYPLPAIQPLLGLSSLRSAKMYGPFHVTPSNEYDLIPPYSSKLQHLHIMRAAIHPRVLRGIISSCENLESLRCDMAETKWPWHELSKTIYPHRNTLKSLELTIVSRRDWPFKGDKSSHHERSPDETLIESFGFLHEYTCLETLVTNEEALLEFLKTPNLCAILPRGLKSLRLRSLSDSLVPSLEELVEHHEAVVPDLGKIHIDRWLPARYNRQPHGDGDEEGSMARMRELRDSSNAAGIAFNSDHIDHAAWLKSRYGRY